jgi:hypothetical protein
LCTFENPKSTALSLTRTLNLLLFFLFLSLASVAQKNVCSFSLPVHFTFRYTEEKSDFSRVSNEMIAVIAEDAVKNRRRVSFTLTTDIRIRIAITEGRNPMAGISFGPQRLDGNIFFRKFSMASVMMPGRVAFGCRIEKKDSSSFFDLPEATGLKFSENDSLFLCQVPRYSCDSDTVVVHHLRFYFDEDAISRFRERVTLINDYYAANAILDSLENKITNLDFGDINRYPGYFIILQELNKILTILNEKNLSLRLGLDSLDPEGFLAKYNRLTRFSLSATMTFRENLKTPGIMNSAFATDSLIQLFLDRMGCYIRWSNLVSERNSKIYDEFLERYFRLNAFEDDPEVIRNLVVKMFPGQNPDSVLAMISRKINKAYHDRANELLRNRQYADAVELLGNARKFSEINPYLIGVVNDRDIITTAANGIYDSYLGVAEGALRNGKPEMARSYMLRAQGYRKEHAAFVTSDSLFNKVFDELLAENVSRCDTLYAFSEYPEALDFYREFENGFDSLTFSLIHPGLNPKIQFCRYMIFIREGEKNLAKFEKPEAGRNFFLARQLSGEENYYPDPLLDSLCKVTYPFYLIHLLYAGEGRIWTNRLESARRFADSIAFIQRTTGAGSSRELSDALAGYRRKVEERVCWNANEAVEVFLLRSQRNRELKDFAMAAALTDSATLLIQLNTDCRIPSAGMSDTVSKYAQAVQFQKMQRNIDLLVVTGQYEKAIMGYLEMEHFFTLENIRRFALESKPMYDYVSERSRQELTVGAFLYFQGKKDLQEGFRYLKLLRLEDYPVKNAKPFLEWLGKEYAEKDFRDQPDEDPVTLVRNYTGRDKWMRRFRVEYYQEAALLRHQPAIKYLFRKYFP